VFFCKFPSRLLCGEIRQVTIELVNTGSRPLRNVKVASTHPEFFTFGPSRSNKEPGSTSETSDTRAVWPDSVYPVLSAGKKEDFFTIKAPKSAGSVCQVPLKGTTIEPGETVQVSMWVRGPGEPGEHSVNFLFYYEPESKTARVR
jgi:hypothetical protein